ncbi:hypothetical protein CGC21_19040 [Leishmania donovani]|uniref:Uncharacterized protein n=1 Tax=Leishmania donovani TaxID=5661 RepID=A0A504Y0N6_LEIDO|nr:hypothetical protein CGC21_19040 [Leishmania donovani]
MAGLQSENISINSTRLPEQSTSDKDICPCALVHCDNAGRRIFCPKCHCVSRLAQSGRRRTRSAAAATDADADRVSIDDGVSSTRSRRTRTGTTPHRSALKGKSGTLKRRASSVQFPANPTTSIVPGDGVSVASGAVAVPSEGDSAGEQHHQRRASSPLTQEAVDALPLDPVEARRRRAREQQQQLRAAEAAAKAEKAVGLYAITAAPPPKVAPHPPSATAASGLATNEGFKKVKDRSRSQPVPKLPHTILEPKEEYPVPPPLVLHTVEEEEAHAPAATGESGRDAKPVLPAAAAGATAAATAEEDVKAEKSASALAPAWKTSVTPRQMEDEVEAAMAASADKSQTTGVLPPPTGTPEELARPHQLLDDCENTEAEERGVVGDLEAHERAALMQRMEEEDTAIRARRGLVVEFDSTPILVTSDDELSQRASGYKSATRSDSASRRRRRTSVNGASELRAQSHENMAGESDARPEKGGQAAAARTPGDALSSAAKSVAGSGSAEITLSPMTAARQGRVLASEEVDDGGKLIATRAALAEADAKAKAEAEAAHREGLAREALEQAEAAVREHYERGADEWLTAALPHELEAQRLVRAAAERRRQQEQQQAHLAAEEGLDRDEVEEAEANAWSWLLSGARVDRVVAATEEGDRVQREYEELRFERLQLQLREDTAELVHEEAHGRASFIEYEAATRSLLQSHHAVQRQALAEGERRQEVELLKKAAARREAALRQRFQWELDELDAEEVSGRAMLREVEREERRTAHLVFLQTLASIRRKEVLAQHAAAVAAAAAADEPGGTSVLSEASTMIAAQVHRRVQQRQTDAAVPLMIEGDGDGVDDNTADMVGAATPPQFRTPLITAKELAELRAREASYAAELQAALERLREAERRVAEEAAIRAQAEQERQAAHAESQRLLQEAEQRAEQRIREARDAAEQLLQAQLADLRDEAVRRAEHAAVMQALAEEEQRAVLEAKLQAAQRQLDEAQQRAQEEVRRARADAAEMAAADAARAAREAQRRDEEWQERCRAEHLLRLAEQEREKEEAVRRLAEIEVRAAEAVRLAREEAARTAAEAQERLAEMERRQQAREAEVQSAAQRVRSVRDSLREFDSSTQSSRYATPFRAVLPGQRPPTSSSSYRAPSLVAASSTHATHTAGAVATQASVHTPLQTPPLVPSSSRTSSAVRRQPSAQSPTPRVAARVPAAGAAASLAPSDATPPKVIISSQHTPLSSAVAPGLGRSGAAVPSSSASAAGATSLAAMDPADIIRAAIRSAVQEIVEAQRRTQTLQDRAEQNVELSERRYHRRQSDRLRAARDVAAIESSYAASEVDESEERHQRWRAWSQQPHQRTRQRQPVRGYERDSRVASSRMSEERLRSVRSSRGDYAQEVSESPWTRSSSSPASRLSPTGAPLSTAPPAPAARSVSSNTLLSTSSVYFDNSYQPSAAAFGAAHQHFRRNGCDYAAAREAWAAEDGECGYAQRMHAGVGARAYSRVASEQQQRYATGAAQPPPRQPLLQTVGVAAALPSAAHAYNEPEPLPPAPAAMEYSPPPRRSTTRAAAEVVPQQQSRPAGVGANVGSGGGIAALPEPTRKLCCTAHHRAQLREFTRRKTYESGKAATTVGAGKVPHDAAHFADEPAARLDVGTSPLTSISPPSMISPSASYQAFTMAGPAAPSQQPIYSPGYHSAATTYPYAYSHPMSQPHQLPTHQLPFYADSERPHPMPPPLDPYVQPFGQPQPYAPFGYSAQRQQGTTAVAAEAWATHEVPPPESRAAAFGAVARHHASPAELTQSPPPPSALPPSQQEGASEVMGLRAAEGGAMIETVAPAAAAVDDTPDAQVQRRPSTSSWVDDRTHREAEQTVAAENRTLPNATVAAAVAGSAAADASLPDSAPEKQGGTTAPVDARSTPDGGAAAENDGDGTSAATAGATAAAVLEEPKTERKKTFPAFFVSLGDGDDAAEPRRPKPPTPRNFVPSQLAPPTPPRKQQRRTLPSGMLLTSQNRSGRQSAHHQHHPYEQVPKASGARDGPRKTPSHPSSKQRQRQHAHANGTATSITKSIKSYIKSLSPMVVVDESGTPVVYEDVRKVDSGGIRSVGAEAERNRPESSHGHSKMGRYYVNSHIQTDITYAAPFVDRRVPTLAELEKRLQQLRIVDEYEAAQYHRRQAQRAHQQQQQRIHVLLHSPGAVAAGGNTGAFVTASSWATRELAQPLQRRHSSATGRHPQQRTVSPPWRTDLNSSPVRPRWDISQPRSPIYHPAPATMTGN